MIHYIKNLIIKFKFKRTARQRHKAYDKLQQTPYGVSIRNQSYYE